MAFSIGTIKIFGAAYHLWTAKVCIDQAYYLLMWDPEKSLRNRGTQRKNWGKRKLIVWTLATVDFAFSLSALCASPSLVTLQTHQPYVVFSVAVIVIHTIHWKLLQIGRWYFQRIWIPHCAYLFFCFSLSSSSSCAPFYCLLRNGWPSFLLSYISSPPSRLLWISALNTRL